MFMKILIALAVLFAVFLLVAATQPEDFTITRTATFAAAPAAVFPHVNNLHRWQEWSPWARLDPAVRNSYSGPDEGTGAVFSWAGNNKVGEGTMTITASRPADLVQLRLDFVKPFACTNTAEFTFQTHGNQTVVTWTMTGKKNLIAKAMGLVMNMDEMVGGDFEKGLAQLRVIVAKPAGE